MYYWPDAAFQRARALPEGYQLSFRLGARGTVKAGTNKDLVKVMDMGNRRHASSGTQWLKCNRYHRTSELLCILLCTSIIESWHQHGVCACVCVCVFFYFY